MQLEDQGRLGDSNSSLVAAYDAAGQGLLSWQESALVPEPDGRSYAVFYDFLEQAPAITQ